MPKRIEIPEIVPPKCNDCDYFIRDNYWIIESYLGRCEFYDEKRHCDNECIAVTRYRYSLTPNKESTKIENNNQKPICPNCNKPQNDNAVFCKDCGTEISPKELVTIAYCDKCESEYDESYQFCEKDGNQLVLKKKEFDDKPDIETDSFIPNNIESKEQVDESLGFGWGNFAMVMAFLQGFSALGLFIADIQNEYLPERFLAFLTAAICLSGGLGLYQKRKYGLITIYIVQLINIIGGLIAVYDGDEFLQFGGIITIVISVLWGIYFKKREAMFT